MIREIDLPRDLAGLRRLDTSFRTEECFCAEVAGDRVELDRRRLDLPVEKSFPIDLDPPDWEGGFVGLQGDTLVAFVAWRFEQWNQRFVLVHFYVEPGHRRRGLGLRLMEISLRRAVDLHARTAWLETSNLNVSGVAVYQKLGFSICGFDLTLYRGTDSHDEFALFLARDL